MKSTAPTNRRLSIAGVADQLLTAQYNILRRNEAGAIAGRSTEPLHDLRVAIRRLRAVLRFFRKPLAATSARSLDAALGRLNRSLGPARDVDVWVDYLLSQEVKEKLARGKRWSPFLQHQLDRQRQQQAQVACILSGQPYTQLRRRLEHFLNVELPHAAAGSKPGDLKRFIAKKVRKAFRRALKTESGRLAVSAETLHQSRVRIRRARYWAEFFEPMLGPVSRRLSRRLKQTADELGWVHDLDLQLDRFCRTKPSPPPRLVKELKRKRRSHLRKSRKALHRVKQAQFKRRVLGRLKRRAAT